jgi:hypothetical protein
MSRRLPIPAACLGILLLLSASPVRAHDDDKLCMARDSHRGIGSIRGPSMSGYAVAVDKVLA